MNSNFTPINNSNQLKSDNYFLNSSFPISINSNKSSNENQINLNMSFSKKNNFQINKENIFSENSKYSLNHLNKCNNIISKNQQKKKESIIYESCLENNFSLQPNYFSLLSIYYSIKNIDKIYKSFEENIINNKNFSICSETYIIMSKNKEASEMMKRAEFWIIYLEYLFKLNKIKSREQFIKLIKEAFNFENNNDNELLKKYYIEKIQIFFPFNVNNNNIIDQNKYISLLDNKTKHFFNEKYFGPKRIQKEKKKINKTLEGINKISKINFEKINENKLKNEEKNIKNINDPIYEETRDTVDETYLFSLKKDFNFKTPFKNNKNDFLTEEIYPDDLVEGSILKFNQSFLSSQNSTFSK